MDNKLSELSNPAWIVGQQEIADFMRGDEALLVRGYDPESTEPALRMYSQEYVSALLARIAELERILDGVTPVMTAGGWTAKGISDYAKSLETKLATPVRLPRTLWYEHDDLAHEIPVLEKKKVVAEIRAAGFKVEGG